MRLAAMSKLLNEQDAHRGVENLECLFKGWMISIDATVFPKIQSEISSR